MYIYINQILLILNKIYYHIVKIRIVNKLRNRICYLINSRSSANYSYWLINIIYRLNIT